MVALFAVADSALRTLRQVLRQYRRRRAGYLRRLLGWREAPHHDAVLQHLWLFEQDGLWAGVVREGSTLSYRYWLVLKRLNTPKTMQLLTIHYENYIKSYTVTGSPLQVLGQSRRPGNFVLRILHLVLCSYWLYTSYQLASSTSTTHKLTFQTLIFFSGCALPPDYSLSKNYDDEFYGKEHTQQTGISLFYDFARFTSVWN